MTTKRIAVTGGARGIGRAIALAAAERGWAVAVLDLDGAAAVEVAAEARSAGAPIAAGIACDVADEASVLAALAATSAAVGPLDGIVANAGIEANGPLHEFPLETWERTLSVNLTGVFLTCKHAIAGFLASGRPGSIVCTSSPSAFVGFAGGGNAAYGSAKGGVSAFVRSAALDYAHAGIRVNALVPGATDTPLLLEGLDGDERVARAAEIARSASEQIPLGRLAQPAEVAAAAIWLLGDESSYVTGSNLVCDGGLLAKSPNTF